MSNEPIVINPNSTIAQLAALGRYTLTAGGAYALGKGWIEGELLNFLTGFITIAAPTFYGVWRTWTTRKTLVKMAESVPDEVATLK